MVTERFSIRGTGYIKLGYNYEVVASEYYGKSTDEKPTEGVRNSEVFYEMDTQKVFLFDEAEQKWLEQ